MRAKSFSSLVMADERCPALLHVDSFTRVAFAGNPAAVCLLDAPAGKPNASAYDAGLQEEGERRRAPPRDTNSTASASPARPGGSCAAAASAPEARGADINIC